MLPHFLALSLPAAMRSRLASLCYGLPQVHWVEEENFHITLRYFGPLTDQAVSDIHEHLENLFFTPFSLVLQGVGHFSTKGKRGVIWVGIAENAALTSLKKEIDRLLRGLHLLPDERSFHPHIVLGYYERLNPQKLGDYLMTHANYQSGPIEVTSCLLMRSLQTSKHVIYDVVDEYEASRLATGED